MFLADFTEILNKKHQMIFSSCLMNCLKICSSEEIGFQMNHLYLSFEKPILKFISFFWDWIKNNGPKTKALSKCITVWSTFKYAPSMKNMGSTL